jgi:hypothetical protein
LAGRFGNLLCESFEFSVEHLATLAFLLLELDFVFITVSILAFSIPGLVELNIGSLTEELDILLNRDGQYRDKSVQITRFLT